MAKRGNVRITLTADARAALERIHPRLQQKLGVLHFGDTVRAAIARGIKQLEVELGLAADPVAAPKASPPGQVK